MTHAKMYMVYTPEYGTVIPILDDGSGPKEYGADVLLVRATNKRRAKVLAVRRWRHRPRGKWVENRDSDLISPFAGLKAEEVTLDWRIVS